MKKATIMSNLTSNGLALPQALRQAARDDKRHDVTHYFAKALSWVWAYRRRREVLNTLRKVDDRLLRDAGIEPSELNDVVDNLIARWR